MPLPTMLIALIAFCSPGLARGDSARVFAKTQAEAGAKSYQTHCAPCHQPDLSGMAVPALAGPIFLRRWGKHTTGELFDYVKSRMPHDDPDSLPEAEYVDIVAFIMAANGALPGGNALTGSTQVRLNLVIHAAK
jgi:mono/diheme cytochrome c family protein